jgi:hypothetical protein
LDQLPAYSNTFEAQAGRSGEGIKTRTGSIKDIEQAGLIIDGNLLSEENLPRQQGEKTHNEGVGKNKKTGSGTGT